MCHDFSAFHAKQQGSALVVAVFIIVVMTLLVAALSRVLTSSSESISYEVLGSRAFFAAQSGMEQGLARLFPLTTVSTYCAPTVEVGTEPPTTISLTVNGLQGCSFTLSCKSGRASPEVTETIYYQLTSTGTCGDPASVQTSRTIEMEVWQ
jgi:MSHA biogenesis protein MshP